MEKSSLSIHGCVALAYAVALLAACGGESRIGSGRAPLSAQCVADDALPDDAWLCPDSRTLDCSEVDDATLYVVESEDVTCAGEPLKLSDSGPFAPGTHLITVT